MGDRPGPPAGREGGESAAAEAAGAWLGPVAADEVPERVRVLAGEVPALREVLAAHLEFFEEYFDYVFLADVARWAVTAASGPARADADAVLAVLDGWLGAGDPAVDDLLGAGFLEALTRQDLDQLRPALGPRLAALLARREAAGFA